MLHELIREGPRVAEKKTATAIPATTATEQSEYGASIAVVATVAVADAPREMREIEVAISEREAESRRQKVLEMLRHHPEIRYAFVTDSSGAAASVTITLAIRDLGVVELTISATRFDALALLDIAGELNG